MKLVLQFLWENTLRLCQGLGFVIKCFHTHILQENIKVKIAIYSAIQRK